MPKFSGLRKFFCARASCLLMYQKVASERPLARLRHSLTSSSVASAWWTSRILLAGLGNSVRNLMRNAHIPASDQGYPYTHVSASGENPFDRRLASVTSNAQCRKSQVVASHPAHLLLVLSGGFLPFRTYSLCIRGVGGCNCVGVLFLFPAHEHSDNSHPMKRRWNKTWRLSHTNRCFCAEDQLLISFQKKLCWY